MKYSDIEKLKRLRTTFDLNYRLTGLYANYLSSFPEIITEELVNTLCEGGDITKEEAIVALLCEIFALDDRAGGEDRILIRNYIRRSVRILDAAKYTENPYYKNGAPKAAKLDNWEIKWEFYPPYRAAICDDMVIESDYTEIPPIGFFTNGFSFPAVLEDGNEWMTLTPVDVDTCDAAIDAAHGKVVTFGLGLGYYAYMVSQKCEVDSITIVEKSEKVIKLFKEKILPAFTHPEKVRIINCDAFEYAEKMMPKEKYDYAFVDTWRDASDGAPMYEKMKKLEHLSKETKFDYWIENFLISRLRALKFEKLWDSYEKASTDAPQSYNDFIERLNDI